MSHQTAIETVPFAEAGRRLMPAHPVPGLAFNVAAAASALAAGACLVGVGVSWAPPPDDAAATGRGGMLYAAECASCHGARLEGHAARTQADAGPPPLDATGHAWQHSDAELAAIIAQGIKRGGTPGMPSFAERLDRDEIDAILAYLKKSWPVSVRAYQASLNPGAKTPLAALLRNPAWVFPGQCQPPPVQRNQITINTL